MRKILVVVFLLTVAVSGLWAQPIATVDLWQTKVDVDTPDSYTWTHHRVVTIRHERMRHLLDFYMQLDANEELVQFSLTLNDAQGRLVGKVKQNGLERTEYSRNLATDCYYLYKKVTSPVYPVTMTLDYRVRRKANVLSYPSFNPQNDFGLEVKDAVYELMLAEHATCQYAAISCGCKPTESVASRGRRQLTFTMKDVPPVNEEDRISLVDGHLPQVMIGPRQFRYYQTKGSMESWQTLGAWNYQLLKGRNILPPQAVERVHQLTDRLSNAREKIAALYELLRKTTRYVSIQLGIGGYQPMSVTDVWNTGIGDCKALVNYMQSLLSEVGINSIYTLVSTTDKQLLHDMANFQQLDHVLLAVPEQGDTLWIECTNPELPLGYVHDDIAGHDAVCLTGQGGQLVQLPQYADSLHLRKTKTEIVLSADGGADIEIQDDYYYDRYPTAWYFGKQDKRRQQELAGHYYFLPQSELTGISMKNHLEPYGVPMSSIEVKAHSRRYANQTSQRLFVSLNPLKQGENLNFKKNSQNGYYIEKGYANQELLVIRQPQDYIVETVPNDIDCETPLGHFSQRVVKEDGKIMIERCLLIRHGLWLLPEMKEVSDFFDTVRKQYNTRLVLKKVRQHEGS